MSGPIAVAQLGFTLHHRSSIVLLLLLGALVAPGTGVPATAASCGDPSGPVAAPPGAPTTDAALVVATRGRGHGRGMSQYAARGAGQLGCSADRILEVSYPGTDRVARSAPRPEVAVGLLQDAAGGTADVRSHEGPLRWSVSGCAVAERCRTAPPEQPTGMAWHVVVTLPSGEFVITDGDGREVWRGGDYLALLSVAHEGVTAEVSAGGRLTSTRYGRTTFDSSVPGGPARLWVVTHVTGGDGRSAVERYLYGVREMPSSWPTATLEAQVVAVRTYLLNRMEAVSDPLDRTCRCDVFGTPADVDYRGWAHEQEDRLQAGGRWAGAVDDTAGTVITFGGSPILARFSASHGGRSSSERAIAPDATDRPYLAATDVAGWERAGDDPYLAWSTAGLDAAALAQAFGLDVVESLVILDTDGAGRATTLDDARGARIIGRVAGAVVVQHLGAEALRSRLATASGGAVGSGLVRVLSQAGPDLPIERACPAGRVPPGGFPDTERTPHRHAIDCIAWWGIAAGREDGRYEPGTSVTRAQMATFVRNLADAAGVSLSPSPPDAFTDDDGDVHEHAIDQLAEAGLVGGVGGGRYEPRLPVTRGQMATFLATVVERAEGAELPVTLDYFTDDARDVHARDVDAVREAHLAGGVETDRRYAPAGAVTRGQMASFIARALDRLVRSGHASPPSG